MRKRKKRERKIMRVYGNIVIRKRKKKASKEEARKRSRPHDG